MSGISERLHIFERGSGPAVLLLHGAPYPAEYLSPLVRDLERDHRVLVPDLPGYGRSPALPPGWKMESAHELVEAALLERGAGELAVVGFSLGAYHALALACRGRLRIRLVVALAGFETLADEERAVRRGFAEAVRSGVDLGDALVERMLAPEFARSHPEVVESVRGCLGTIAPAAFADEILAMAEMKDLSSELRSLRIPVVARVGELDLTAPPDHTRRIASLVPGARLELVPNVAHALFEEDFPGTLASIRRALTAS